MTVQDPRRGAAIRFEHVWKAYHLGQSHRSLREAIATAGRTLASRRHEDADRLFWALRDVSFEVAPGEALGVIGPNGAGKTTTLKLLSGITQPTQGRIAVNGRISALIELGAGFHPDLTGRENIYLNAAILGLTRQDIDRRFNRIVEFSGLEQFIDTPVKRYSSGMYVRLGFSIAAHVEPEVLLVDEVLAVGDSQFRQRCAERIHLLRRTGVTILFVSHNLYLVQSVCDAALFLAEGRIQAQGDTVTVTGAYESWLRQAVVERGQTESMDVQLLGDDVVRITEVKVQSRNDSSTDLRHDAAVDIKVSYIASQTIQDPKLYIKILRGDGSTCCMIRSNDYGYTFEPLRGTGVISLAIEPLQLTPGIYSVDAEIVGALDGVALTERLSPWFEVRGSTVGREGIYVPMVADIRVERLQDDRRPG